MIVTAQKREQSVQDVSAAVTAISSERLQNAHINNIEDLQLIAPSIHLGNDFHMAKTFIRGVGANTSTTGSETGVAMYVDGAYVSRAEAQLTSIFDLQRVEVLRGPQGTLYGRNAVGGSINLVTAKPTREFEGYGHLTVGDYKNISGDGAVSGPITDTLLGRAAFKIEHRAGFGINPATGNDVDNLDRAMARVHLNWVPTDAIDDLLTGEYYTQHDASSALKLRQMAFPNPLNPTQPLARLFPIGRPIAGRVGGFANDPRDLAEEADPETETDTWAVTNTLNWRANDRITLTNIANYREFEGFITQDLDLSSIQNGANAAQGGPATGTGNNSSVQRRDVKSHQISDEQQFKYASDWLNTVLGFFYFAETQRPVDTVGFGPVLGEPNILAALNNPSLFPLPPFTTGLNVDGVNFLPPANSAPVNLSAMLDLCNTGNFLGGGTNSAVPPPPKRVCIKSHLTTDAWAVFGQGTINLGKLAPALESLSIKLGARYSHEKVTASNPSLIVARNGLGPVLLTTTAGSYNERTFNNFSPEAGLEWKPTDKLLIYYTYSRGFKAGAGQNAAPDNFAFPFFKSAIVNPEKIENHEAGIKSQWFDNRLIVNIAGFTYDLRDQQINKTLSGGPAGFTVVFQNDGRPDPTGLNTITTTAKGVELEFTALVTDDFRVNGSLNWLDSKYKNFWTFDPLDPRNIQTPGPCPVADPPSTCFGPLPSPNPTVLGNIQLAGNPTRDSPKWTAAFHAEYDLKGLDLFGDGGYLTPGVDVSYTSDVFFTEFHRLLEGQKAYTLVDGNLRFTSGNERLTADFWVKNISDKLVASSTFQLATGRVIGVTYLPPRMFGFTVGYKF